MPIFASKYRLLPLNCVQDFAMISWQGVSLYFAQKPVLGVGVVVAAGLTPAECVGVGMCECGLCRVLDIVLEMLCSRTLCAGRLGERVIFDRVVFSIAVCDGVIPAEVTVVFKAKKGK